MTFSLNFTSSARIALKELKDSANSTKQFKAVSKALDYLQQNPRYPSLQTHKIQSLKGFCNEEIFEAYAEQNTPGAYRIFFHYGPQKGEITVFAVMPHP